MVLLLPDTTFLFVLLPLISALLCLLGIRLFLRFLFRKILPAQMPAVTQTVAAEAGKIVAQSGLAEKAADPALVKNLMPGIEAHINGFLQQRLTEKVPVLAMFLSEQLLNTIRETLLAEIELLLPNVIGQFAGKLEEQLDVERLVKNRLSSITASDLENKVRTNLKGQINKLQLGAFCWGLLIGLIQAFIVGCLLVMPAR
jgi:hypothetical protein